MDTNRVTHNPLKPIALGLALVLASSAAFSTARAQDKNITTETSLSQYVGWGDPEMAQIAINSGRALLQDLRSASALLDEGRVSQARAALYTSHEFSAAIERMMPYLVVVRRMKDLSQKVVEEEADVFSADLLPIYASLNDLEIYAPKVAQKTRRMVQQAGRHAAKGNKQRAANVLKEAADIVARQTVYLPVEYVDMQVNAALYAVSQPKPDTAVAKLAVNRAVDSLTTVVNAVVEPAAG